MGVGKSTIGKVLAQTLHIDFIDLDEFIERKENTSISTIFEKKGEIRFRKLETNYLNELMNKNASFVLSLGGGTPCYADNMQVIQSKSFHSIYLKASFQFLSQRLFNQSTQRPLLNHLNTLDDYEDFIRKHLFERQNYYFQADSTISVENYSVDEIVNQIQFKINN